MSNDINGLLNTFKTNMMNNGITVNSGDKFKSLIDKIATLAGSEGKGIQFATGSYTPTGATEYATIPWDLDFNPTYIFAHCTSTKYNYSNMCYTNGLVSNINNLDSYFYTGSNQGQVTFSIHAFDTSTLTIRCNSSSHTGSKAYINSSVPITWYAIGVGEEDTTLRDSLASILENKGVDVTEEDDMVSLINKVDEEFDNSLSILPGTKYTMREGTGYSNTTNITSFTEIDSYTFVNNGTFTCTMDVRVQGSVSSGSMTGKLELYDSNNELIYTSEEITSTVDEDDSTKTLTVDLAVKKGYIIKLLVISSGLTIMSICMSSGISITFDLN